MGNYFNPGNEKFDRMIHSEIYVDKTELIAYTNGVINTLQEYVCVSRPRRFGKSMTANMLAAYYSRGCSSESLFQNLIYLIIIIMVYINLIHNNYSLFNTFESV